MGSILLGYSRSVKPIAVRLGASKCSCARDGTLWLGRDLVS